MRNHATIYRFFVFVFLFCTGWETIDVLCSLSFKRLALLLVISVGSTLKKMGCCFSWCQSDSSWHRVSGWFSSRTADISRLWNISITSSAAGFPTWGNSGQGQRWLLLFFEDSRICYQSRVDLFGEVDINCALPRFWSEILLLAEFQSEVVLTPG